MTMKKGIRKAMGTARPTKRQMQLLDMYSSEHAPTPYMTKALAKVRRRNKLAKRARRNNR